MPSPNLRLIKTVASNSQSESSTALAPSRKRSLASSVMKSRPAATNPCPGIDSVAQIVSRPTRILAERRMPIPIRFIATIVIVIFIANVDTLSTLMIGKTDSTT